MLKLREVLTWSQGFRELLSWSFNCSITHGSDWPAHPVVIENILRNDPVPGPPNLHKAGLW
jgi:hypothetical protein